MGACSPSNKRERAQTASASLGRGEMGAGASAEKKEGATAKLAAIGAFAQPPPPPAAAVSPPADDLADPDPDPAAAALPGSGGSEGGAAVPSPEEHPPVCKARALYDLEAEHPEDLVLRKGQIVFVDEIPPEGSQGGEWWRGRVLRGGRYESGIFPRSYVERLPEEEDERGGDEVRAAGPASVSSHDEYDDLVHLINTDGPQPDFTPAASGLVAAAAAAVPALEDPAGRGFVECPTLKLFRCVLDAWVAISRHPFPSQHAEPSGFCGFAGRSARLASSAGW